MKRTLMILALVGTFFMSVGSPSFSVTPANAAEKAGSHYCENIPDSLVKAGFVPGVCR